MERPRLRQARLDRGWSQAELAKRIEVVERSIHDWELGESTPSARNRRALCDVFGCKPEDIDLGPPGTRPKPPPNDHMTQPSHHITPPDTMQDFLACHLLTIVHSNYSTPDEMTNAIRNAIEEYTMHNPDDHLSRRDALCLLAGLPMSMLGQNPALANSHYDQTLRHATSALEACWQLYRDSDPVGTQHAFKCVSVYVPLLETIARNSSQYHKEALALATRYALLQTLLSWERLQPLESIGQAQHAFDLSKETGNILLQMSATTKLNWSYVRSKQYPKALLTMQEGESLLHTYQQKRRASLPSGMIGNFYSGYAQAQTYNGINPDVALGIAIDSKPLHGEVALVEFTAPSQWWEVAWIYCAKGDSAQAIVWLEKLMDLETLTIRQHITKSEASGALNILTHALLQSKDPDMEHIIRVWTAGMEEAKTLKHEVMYQEAVTNFERMHILYPGEQAVRNLAPLTAHW